MNNYLASALAYVRNFSFGEMFRHIMNQQFFNQMRSAFSGYEMLWYFLLFCASAAVLSLIAIEMLAPSQTATNAAQKLSPKTATEQQAAAAVLPNVERNGAAPAYASPQEATRQRLRDLELKCDTLIAKAQRSSRLEDELAAANIRIEELTHLISSYNSASTPRATFAAPAPAPAPAAAPAAAPATPTLSGGTPLKVSHRTPSSAAKSLTMRPSVLQKAQTTPSVTFS